MKYNYFLKFIFVEYILGLIWIIGTPIFGGMLYIVFPPVILMYMLGLAGFFGIIPQELAFKLSQLYPLNIVTITFIDIAFQLYIIYKIYKIIVEGKISSTPLRIVALHHIFFAGICVYAIIHHIDEILRNYVYFYYLIDYLIFIVRIPLNVMVALMAKRVVDCVRSSEDCRG